MSATNIKDWNVLRPTDNAEQFESSLWPANQERIIELDSEPKINEIEIMNYNESDATIDCLISYQTGESKRMELLSKKVKELVYRDKPALIVVE